MIRRRLLALGVGVGLLGATAVATPAQAADVVSAPLASMANGQQVATFWLADGGANLKSATPYAPTTEVHGERTSDAVVPSGKPGLVVPVAPEAEGQLPQTSGKVFFVGADGQPHWCSGTAVQSQYRNLVATDAHCVYDMEGAPATVDKWAFVPGYTEGTTPFGLYVGKQAFTHYDFTQYKDQDRDFAFVNVYYGVVPSASGALTSNGRLADIVGAQGLAFNQPIDQTTTPTVDVFGYPAGPNPDGTRPYTGATLERSTGQTFVMRLSDPPADQPVGVDSPFTGEGALGSSWLQTYSDDQGLGYLNGITTGVSDTDGDGRYDTGVSPYFDTGLYLIFRAAAATWSGRITIT
ncbi:trypsin-like serine peptidase [Nonomuraea sp. CA-143628]|uniref:trypsin-like serine peptidase n=1 Tax=Nonomuraea sp. CA-143628 TaxID=3239997 RepID=UPI003D93D574